MVAAALAAARELAESRKPVVGSMLRAVVLLPARKVRAPSCRGREPIGDPTGAAAGDMAGLDSGEPAVHSQLESS